MREVKEPAHFCKIYHLAEEGLINNGPAVYTIVNIEGVGSSRDVYNRRMWGREAPEGCKI